MIKEESISYSLGNRILKMTDNETVDFTINGRKFHIVCDAMIQKMVRDGLWKITKKEIKEN